MIERYGSEESFNIALQCRKIRKIGTKYVDNDTMVRLDIFKKQNKFYAIPIYTMDIALGKLPDKLVTSSTNKEWIQLDESYEFCFSLHNNDLVLIQKKVWKNLNLHIIVLLISAMLVFVLKNTIIN